MARAANAERGEVPLTLKLDDGAEHEFVLRPDFSAIQAVERECDCAMVAILQDCSNMRLRMTHAEACVWHGIAAGDPEARKDGINKRRMIQRALMRKGIAKLTAPVMAFAIAALDGGEPLGEGGAGEGEA